MSQFLTTEEFVGCFERFQNGAFRVDLLPYYNMPDEQESFDRWKAGGPLTEYETNSGWQQLLRGWREKGKAVHRVKVVNGPLTDYQRNGIEWWYPHNDAAGEETRILDISRVEVELPPQDFWEFDGKTVVLMDYDEDNQFLGARILDGDISPYLYWKEQLWNKAVSWRDFIPVTS